jgi:shikimate dehydrogenase
VTFANRTVERAAAAAGRGAAFAPTCVFRAVPLTPAGLASADVVVVATAPAAADVGHDWPLDALAPGAWVCDLNYWHHGPSLRARAAAAGHPTDDGLGMLAWQAALAFEHFTGVAADGATVLARLRSTVR